MLNHVDVDLKPARGFTPALARSSRCAVKRSGLALWVALSLSLPSTGFSQEQVNRPSAIQGTPGKISNPPASAMGAGGLVGERSFATESVAIGIGVAGELGTGTGSTGERTGGDATGSSDCGLTAGGAGLVSTRTLGGGLVASAGAGVAGTASSCACGRRWQSWQLHGDNYAHSLCALSMHGKPCCD